MTLIDAWRTPQGIVVHADSQETVGDYRVEVKKIQEITVGDWQLIIVGAGRPGDLIDSFSIRMRRAMAGFTSTSLADLLQHIETELGQFYVTDVHLCPDPEKSVRFLIAAACRVSQQYECWTTKNITLCPIPNDSVQLLGWDEALYQGIANKFFHQKMSVAQAILAGVYLFTVAGSTSNYVKEPFAVSVVKWDGIWREEDSYISTLVARLRDYERSLNQLFLCCADTQISPSRLGLILEAFNKHVQALHQQQLDVEVQKAQNPAGGIRMTVNPASRLPPGTSFTVSPQGRITKVEYDVDFLAEVNQAMRDAEEDAAQQADAEPTGDTEPETGNDHN
jgi:hypothetical protein